jgi:hypothetical protein
MCVIACIGLIWISTVAMPLADPNEEAGQATQEVAAVELKTCSTRIHFLSSYHLLLELLSSSSSQHAAPFPTRLQAHGHRSQPRHQGPLWSVSVVCRDRGHAED